MAHPVIIAPSILAADLTHLADEVALVEGAGAGMIHIDVMDGHFVPNLTMGVPFVKALATTATVPLDIHLMISNPLEQLPWYIEAGARSITIHQEALSPDDIETALSMMEDAGVAAAISINPETNPAVLAPVLSRLAMVLVMSVHPGFAGQRYIEGSELKIATVRAMAEELGCESLLIEVDGGIDETTIGRCAAAGADVFVCGNAVYKAPDPAAALQAIRAAGIEARNEVA